MTRGEGGQGKRWQTVTRGEGGQKLEFLRWHTFWMPPKELNHYASPSLNLSRLWWRRNLKQSTHTTFKTFSFVVCALGLNGNLYPLPLFSLTLSWGLWGWGWDETLHHPWYIQFYTNYFPRVSMIATFKARGGLLSKLDFLCFSTVKSSTLEGIFTFYRMKISSFTL